MRRHTEFHPPTSSSSNSLYSLGSFPLLAHKKRKKKSWWRSGHLASSHDGHLVQIVVRFGTVVIRAELQWRALCSALLWDHTDEGADGPSTDDGLPVHAHPTRSNGVGCSAINWHAYYFTLYNNRDRQVGHFLPFVDNLIRIRSDAHTEPVMATVSPSSPTDGAHATRRRPSRHLPVSQCSLYYYPRKLSLPTRQRKCLFKILF